MKYIFVDFEGFQYWIEVNQHGFALRQITKENDCVQISCRDNCLAEGIVDIDEYCQQITAQQFEHMWHNTTKPFRRIWEIEKEKYAIGQRISGVIQYFYPQGAIFSVGRIQGCSNRSTSQSIHSEISGVISGFDEKNMWLLLKEE
ncbi:hypothetical protein R6U77_14190 [Lysinibacillus louembei]|uniref:S1 motif domain-containing protein n=1 Tax=Lysinibacillus louembei TaxID=1470088 RepID=A0ABZ0RVG0_9BACI|nr:hypothetical protein [Lysinibacillus louembei]WPK11029.1 hypothetical protein R6U77_14190 [Lysinibacillus louembei]